MPIKNFEIWNEEIKEFIDQVHPFTANQLTLTNWFYNEGLAIFVVTQKNDYSEFKEKYPDNIMTNTTIQLQKKVAFDALSKAFIAKFSDDKHADKIKELLQEFQQKCLSHQGFFGVQATAMNALSKAKANLSFQSSSQCSPEETYLKTLKQIAKDIETYIAFTQESLQLSTKKNLPNSPLKAETNSKQPTVKPASENNSSFFHKQVDDSDEFLIKWNLTANTRK